MVSGLQRLVDHQILTTGDIGDYVQFAFRHDLIVEEVYNSADRAIRQTTHSALADAVLSGVGTDLDPAVAAKHLDKAGRQVEAVGQYSTAALAALGAGASRVAVDVLDRALEIVSRWESGPETSVTEMGLHLLRGTGYTAIEGYASPNALSEYTAVHRIAGELGSGLESATALLSLIAFHTVVGNRAEAETLIGDLYKLSEEAGPDMASAFDAELHYNSSFHEFFIGDYEASAREYDRALEIFESRPDHLKVFPGVPPPSDTLTGTLANAAPVEWMQGRMSRAEEMIHQGIERSQGQTFPVGPFMECYTRAYAGWMYAVAGQNDKAAEQYGAMLQLATKHGYGMWVGFAGIHGHITQLHLEVTPERVAQLEGARQIAAATGIRSFQPFFLTEQAWLTGRVGDTDRAFELFSQALATGEDMNERFYEAETLRKRAELFSAGDKHESAAADLANALETASSQGAHVFRLRAILDLARLPEALRPGDVRDGLTEAIGVIAEPDRYPEVTDAKELLARV
jgi:tetratricopeptide (TPR) repeat protein